MAILPVSSVNLDSNNRVGFRGDMEVAPLKRVDSDMEGKARTSVGKYATVPVVVLMTLNPSLSAQAAGNNAPEPKQITMEMPYAPSEASEAEPMYDFASEAAALSSPESAPQTSGVNAPKAWYNTHKIIESFPFVSDGKKYTMQYATLNSDESQVSAVYFIPDGYDKYAKGNVKPPTFAKLVLHNLGNGENFAGAWVRESKIEDGRPATIYKEVELPDDIANRLIDMLSGDYKIPPSKYIRENCIKEVFDSKLLPTEIHGEYY